MYVKEGRNTSEADLRDAEHQAPASDPEDQLTQTWSPSATKHMAIVVRRFLKTIDKGLFGSSTVLLTNRNLARPLLTSVFPPLSFYIYTSAHLWHNILSINSPNRTFDHRSFDKFWETS